MLFLLTSQMLRLCVWNPAAAPPWWAVRALLHIKHGRHASRLLQRFCCSSHVVCGMLLCSLEYTVLSLNQVKCKPLVNIEHLNVWFVEYYLCTGWCRNWSYLQIWSHYKHSVTKKNSHVLLHNACLHFFYFLHSTSVQSSKLYNKWTDTIQACIHFVSCQASGDGYFTWGFGFEHRLQSLSKKTPAGSAHHSLSNICIIYMDQQ